MSKSSGPLSTFEFFELLPLELQQVIWEFVGFKQLNHIVISKAHYPILREIFSKQRALIKSCLAVGLNITSPERLAKEIVEIAAYYEKNYTIVIQHTISASRFINLLKNLLPRLKKELYFCDRAIYFINKAIINTVCESMQYNFTRNRISTYDFSNRNLTLFSIDFLNWKSINKSMPNFSILNLDNNHLKFLCFDELNSLNISTILELRARNNCLQHIPCGLGRFSQLEHIDLSYNEIKMMHHNFGKVTLVLSHNKISQMIQAKRLPTKICLDHNNLEFIPNWLPLLSLHKLNQNLIEPTTVSGLLQTQTFIKNNI